MMKNETKMSLESDRMIVISRTFNAKPKTVFDAWTKPELVARWWAPKSLCVSIVSVEADVRVGGGYRYVIKNEGGDEVAFSGKYTLVAPSTRLAYTQVFEPMAHAGEVEVTITFEEEDGKTNLVARELYPSKEVRDIVIATGMETGMRATMDQLDELVATL
jgi:uncharacterized protein YndB with AHSA1/START domain